MSRWMGKLVSILLLGGVSSSCVDVDGYRLRSDDGHQDPSTERGGAGTQQNVPTDAGAPSSTSVGYGGLGVAGTESSRRTRGAAGLGQGGASGRGGTTGRSGAGGATMNSAHCEQELHSSCEEMTNVADCDGLRGCVYDVKERCVTQHDLTCADLSRSYSNCNAMAGCASSGVGECVSQAQREDCFRIVRGQDCDAAIGCRWVGELGSCLGTPIACEESMAELSCRKRYNCSWGAFECSGTPIACELLNTKGACNTSSNCSWIVPP